MNKSDSTPPPTYFGETLPRYCAPVMNNELSRESDSLLGSRDRERRDRGCFSKLINTIAEKARKIKNWMWRVWNSWDFGLCLTILAIAGLLVLTLFGISMIDFDDCEIPHDADVETVIQDINPFRYQELYFELERGIIGDVVVSQSRDIDERNITVFVSMQASSPVILQYMKSALALDDFGSRAKSRIFIDMPPSELNNALRKTCTRVSVNIVFPQRLTEFKTIEIQSTFKGKVQVRLDNVHLTNSLVITANNGNVVIKNAVVRRLDVVAHSGKIQAQVEVERYVKMTASKDLELVLARTGSALEVNAISNNAFAKVVLMRPFFGHFSISTTSSPPELYPSYYDVVVQKSDNRTLKGYFPQYGNEPGYFPRVEIEGDTALLDVHR